MLSVLFFTDSSCSVTHFNQFRSGQTDFGKHEFFEKVKIIQKYISESSRKTTDSVVPNCAYKTFSYFLQKYSKLKREPASTEENN
jgi:hypothetical protein